MDENLLKTTNNPGSLAGSTSPTPSTGDPVIDEPVATSAITPEALTAEPVIDVPEAPIATGQTAMLSDMEMQAEDDFTKAQKEATTAAEAPKDTALQAYLDQLAGSKGVAGLTSEAYKAPGGVEAIRPELNEINDKIRQEQMALRRAKERIQKEGGGSQRGAASAIANLERESFAKQADLSVIQMAVQGRYDSAKTAADRAVAAKLEQQTNYTNALKFLYEENKDVFDKAEQREFNTLLSNRERSLEEERVRLSDIQNFALTALQSGAPVSVAEAIQKAGSMEEAIALGGEYLRPKLPVTGAGAPEIKNFGTSDAPMWKQYNPETGSWEDVSGLAASGTATIDEISSTNDKIALLRDTISRIKGREADAETGAEAYKPLYKSASQTPFTEFFGRTFTGSSNLDNLKVYADTLKSNMLALATDPSIKQFFGPQMSDADVRLMTATASRLQPDSMTPEQILSETNRLEEFIGKYEASVKAKGQGVAPRANVIIAPDGTEIEIIE